MRGDHQVLDAVLTKRRVDLIGTPLQRRLEVAQDFGRQLRIAVQQVDQNRLVEGRQPGPAALAPNRPVRVFIHDHSWVQIHF